MMLARAHNVIAWEITHQFAADLSIYDHGHRLGHLHSSSTRRRKWVEDGLPAKKTKTRCGGVPIWGALCRLAKNHGHSGSYGSEYPNEAFTVEVDTEELYVDDYDEMKDELQELDKSYDVDGKIKELKDDNGSNAEQVAKKQKPELISPEKVKS